MTEITIDLWENSRLVFINVYARGNAHIYVEAGGGGLISNDILGNIYTQSPSNPAILRLRTRYLLWLERIKKYNQLLK